MTTLTVLTPLTLCVVMVVASCRCSENPLTHSRWKLASNRGFHGRVGRVQNYLFSDTGRCPTGLTVVTGLTRLPVGVVWVVGLVNHTGRRAAP
jgi:hypothetical protein